MKRKGTPMPEIGRKRMLISSEQSASMRFASEMDGAVIAKMDPKLFVSFIRDRGAYRGGIEKMKRIFRGLLSDGLSNGNVNVFAGVDALMVVSDLNYYRPYFGRSL